MKRSLFLSCLLLIFLSVGCKKSPSYSEAESFVDKLNEQAGCCYRTVKTNTYRGGGWIVIRNPQGWYRAINISDYHSSTTELDFFESNQVKVVPSTQYSGSFSDYQGNIYEENSEGLKDLEKIGHFVEELNTQEMAFNLSESFGLSEKRALEVSKILLSWNKVSQKRSLNKKDLNRFSSSLLGMPFEDVQKALEKNNTEDLIEKVSRKNQIDPENMEEFLREFFLR